MVYITCGTSSCELKTGAAGFGNMTFLTISIINKDSFGAGTYFCPEKISGHKEETYLYFWSNCSDLEKHLYLWSFDYGEDRLISLELPADLPSDSDFTGDQFPVIYSASQMMVWTCSDIEIQNWLDIPLVRLGYSSINDVSGFDELLSISGISSETGKDLLTVLELKKGANGMGVELTRSVIIYENYESKGRVFIVDRISLSYKRTIFSNDTLLVRYETDNGIWKS